MLDLISEYKVLETRQIQKYLGLTDDLFWRVLNSLRKKGRIVYQAGDPLVRVTKDIPMNDIQIKCFWIIIDLLDRIWMHCAGNWPTVQMMYSEDEAYEVFYCRNGEETVLAHAIKHMKDVDDARTLIVVDDAEQIAKIPITDAIYCLITEEGGVTYYER